MKLIKADEKYLRSSERLMHIEALNKDNIYVSYSCDYKENAVTEVHNSCELLLFEKGGAHYWINDVLYEMGPNDILIVGSAEPHYRKFTENPCQRYGLTMMPSFLQTLPIVNGYMKVYQTHSPEQAARLKQVDDKIFRQIIDILWHLRDETENNSEGKGNMVYALILELTIILKRLLQIEPINMSESNKVIAEIKNYIDLHYMEDLSLSNLSQIFYLQPNTISKNFTKLYDKNINSYIHSIRIANAVRILQEEQVVSITDLAELVGYSSINTFLRQFRETMGVSPLQYRKRDRETREERSNTQRFWVKGKTEGQDVES